MTVEWRTHACPQTNVGDVFILMNQWIVIIYLHVLDILSIRRYIQVPPPTIYRRVWSLSSVALKNNQPSRAFCDRSPTRTSSYAWTYRRSHLNIIIRLWNWILNFSLRPKRSVLDVVGYSGINQRSNIDDKVENKKEEKRRAKW